eukprot:268198_1
MSNITDVWPQNLHRLNLNIRHQRLILFNIIIFVWSIPYIISYSAILNNEIISTISSLVARWYLSYFIIVLIASCLTILFRRTKSIFIAFIYFSSTIIHIIATYHGIHNQCNSDKWCILSIFSSNSLSILIPFILFIDSLFTFMNDPIKQIIIYLITIFIASISYTIYLFNINNQFNTFKTIGFVGWCIVSISSFLMIIVVIFHNFIANKIVQILNIFFITEISLIIGCVFTFLNSQLLTSSQTFNNYEAWILLLLLCICSIYQLECIIHQNITNYTHKESLKE